jgi:hypothetical protein
MRTTTLTATALVSAALLGLTACGGAGSGKTSGTPGSGTGSGSKPSASAEPAPYADLTGPQLLEKSLAASRKAASLRVKGQVLEEGKAMTMDLALSTKDECRGTMRTADEGGFEVIKSAGTAYIKADEAFYRAAGKGEPKEQTDAVVAMLAGRWMKAPASSPDAKDFAGICDLDELLKAFESDTKGARKGAVATVDGQKAVTLTVPADEGTATVYVAAEGEPYLLKAVQKGGTDPGELAFSDYDEPVDATPPADKDVIDVSKLG